MLPGVGETQQTRPSLSFLQSGGELLTVLSHPLKDPLVFAKSELRGGKVYVCVCIMCVCVCVVEDGVILRVCLWRDERWSRPSGHMSGCMMKGCYHPLNFEGQQRRRWRRWRWVTCRRDSFGWVSEAVGGRWRGVLVPDPCLSGAAMFTVRKEAVSSVCSHLSKTEQLLTPPTTLHTETQTGRDPCVVYFWGGQKIPPKKAGEGVFLWLRSVCSVASVGATVRPESDGPPPQGPGGDWQGFLLEV